MTHQLLDYPRKLRSGGFRVTPQRKAILDAICEAGRPATVEDVIARVRKKSPTLNRATIYRNLIFLRKMHLVDAAGSGREKRFEIASLTPHHHLLCRICGKEEGLDTRYVDPLRSVIRKHSGFVIDDGHLSFHGICRTCSSGRNRKSKGVSENSK